MPFETREEAARLLAKTMSGFRGRNPLVLGIPRGAVPMARIIADELGGELDVVLVHKLGAPGSPEFAVGAVSEDGQVSVRPEAEFEFGVDSAYVAQESAAQLAALQERRRLYTPYRKPIDPADRLVVIVDDGVATGATLLAALRAVREKRPAQLVAAVAVAPPSTVERLRREADEVFVLETPQDFLAVGQFFADFHQVSDEQVVGLLRKRAS